MSWNKDTVEDAVILAHLDELSEGKLKVAAQQLPLSETADLLKFKTKNGNGPKAIPGNNVENNANAIRSKWSHL